ncbi:hypothetical protein NDU88_011973 [Pleurodeles waltl]|uniref:Uncharacterized protein n=1 Tax=Pleurodeles waltl TaxID=8319 RepID=A0AAV7R067_PLEWA|nr:hypothetical protein NDU88_011973 [Pleurodeles waltl]
MLSTPEAGSVVGRQSPPSPEQTGAEFVLPSDRGSDASPNQIVTGTSETTQEPPSAKEPRVKEFGDVARYCFAWSDAKLCDVNRGLLAGNRIQLYISSLGTGRHAALKRLCCRFKCMDIYR